MNNISYLIVSPEIKERIAAQYGIVEANHLHMESGGFSLAAVSEDEVLGFISLYPKQWINPLEGYCDAYIDIIEVKPSHRKKGIAKTMIQLSEEWAKAQGYSQIRAWSSDNKTEALPMWHKLGYCMCPAEIWIEWCKKVVSGYYVAKTL